MLARRHAGRGALALVCLVQSEFVGTEGRAAAPFSYAMVHDEAYGDYAIAMMEGCENRICMWTTELAPFKPIGQLLTLAEFNAIKAENGSSSPLRLSDSMRGLLDAAGVPGASSRLRLAWRPSREVPHAARSFCHRRPRTSRVVQSA